MSRIGTPPELEALVTRKFTCYYRYKELHDKLFDAVGADECTEIASQLLDAYLENRQIYDELKYYESSGSVLGKHPIFKQFQRNREINSMTVKQLMIEQRKLKNNIWRARDELKKGDKPHLDTVRRTRLEQMERDYALVNKLIDG